VTSSCLAQKNRADDNDVRVCEVTTESLLCECFRPFWADDEQPFRNPGKVRLATNRERPTLAAPIDPALRRSYDSQKWPHRLNP
jgi:hypothetical protein